MVEKKKTEEAKEVKAPKKSTKKADELYLSTNPDGDN